MRPDLRLHRKIVVIDDAVGYTGSFNLVDPRFFKQDAGVGEWVDAMVRLEGPGVLALNALFRWDWEVETGRDLDEPASGGGPGAELRAGQTDVQLIPSGPGRTGNNIYQISKTQYLWICKSGSSGRAVSAFSKTWRGSPARFFENFILL